MLNPRLASILHYTSYQLYALIFCCVLVTLSACAQAGGRNYFPLSNNARWEYTVHFSTSSGKQYSAKATIRVDGETLIRGNRYFKLVTSSDFSGFPGAPKSLEDVRYYRVAADGIYFIRGQDTSAPETLEFPLPIPIGTKWLSGPVEAQAERVGTMEVGGRSYQECLKIIYSKGDDPHRIEYYLAPDVGIIKVLYMNATPPPSSMELTLDRYTL
jgi:hypothetical protein